jgi:hypothetical protein
MAPLTMIASSMSRARQYPGRDPGPPRSRRTSPRPRSPTLPRGTIGEQPDLHFLPALTRAHKPGVSPCAETAQVADESFRHLDRDRADDPNGDDATTRRRRPAVRGKRFAAKAVVGSGPILTIASATPRSSRSPAQPSGFPRTRSRGSTEPGRCRVRAPSRGRAWRSPNPPDDRRATNRRDASAAPKVARRW